MEQNEKYGIVLEAKTNLFKKGLKEAINYTKAFGQGVKESFSQQVATSIKNMSNSFREDFNIFDKDYSKRIDYIKDEMDAVADQINAIKEGGKEGNLKELEAEYDRLTKKLEFFTNKQNELNGELEETDKVSIKTSSSLHSLFDRSIAKIKRFSFYLLGARSVFSLFMKYQGIYYQYNEKMRYQSELSQNAIALSLAPAFEFLGKVIAYASIGFAKFIELLTGVNVLSKVSTKGIRDYNKSLKESQSLLSGIDEITNLTLPSSTGLASQYQALNDFQKKIKEVEKFFAENKWINKLVEGLKAIWEFLKSNIWPILDEFIFPIVKSLCEFVGDIFETIGKIFKKLGVVDKVLKPIWAIIKALFHTAQFLVEAIGDIFTLDFDKLERDWKKFKRNIEEDFGISQKINIDVKINNKKDFDTAYNQIKYINEQGGELNVEFGSEKEFEEFRKYVGQTKQDADELNKSLDFQYTIDNDGKVIATFSKQASKDLSLLEETSKGAITGAVKSVLDDVKQLKDLKFTITGNVKMDTANAKSKLQALLDIFDKGGQAGMFAKMALTPIRYLVSRLATGTNYVPYDDFPALLHKGEAVVPAKYNPALGNSLSNDYTNSLLETLVMKIDDLANRPNVFEIDGQKFANATYNLYDNARSRQNYVEGVVR